MILGKKNLETILKRNKYDWGKIAYDKNFHSRIWRTLFLSEDEGVNQLKDFELPYEDLTLRSMFILILFLLGIFMFLILESPILKGLSTGILILLSGYLLWAGTSKKILNIEEQKCIFETSKLIQ